VEELCTGLRGPFVRFLTYVYLNSNSPTALKDIEKFGGDERFVSLIYRLDSTLNEANTIITTDARQAVELLRQPPGIIHTNFLDEMHEKKEVLNYVCDAIIPITGVIFAKHFKKSLKLSTEQLENFVRTLCHYGQNVTPCLSQTAQRLDLLNTIRLATVATHQYIEAPKDLQKRMEIKSESRKKYDQKYKAELELNDKFCLFTKNMWAAYQVYSKHDTVRNTWYLNYNAQRRKLRNTVDTLQLVTATNRNEVTSRICVSIGQKYGKRPTGTPDGQNLRTTGYRGKIADWQRLSTIRQ